MFNIIIAIFLFLHLIHLLVYKDVRLHFISKFLAQIKQLAELELVEILSFKTPPWLRHLLLSSGRRYLTCSLSTPLFGPGTVKFSSSLNFLRVFNSAYVLIRLNLAYYLNFWEITFNSLFWTNMLPAAVMVLAAVLPTACTPLSTAEIGFALKQFENNLWFRF